MLVKNSSTYQKYPSRPVWEGSFEQGTVPKGLVRYRERSIE